MAKVTSKLQVTIPKAIAVRYGIAPGTELDMRPSGDRIEVRIRLRASEDAAERAYRLKLFDQATERQKARDRARKPSAVTVERGWTREELYERGSR